MKDTSMIKLVDKMENLPYHRFIELKVASWGDGRAELTFPLSKATRNAFGAVHGGIYYTVCDVAAFIAASSLIPEGYFAVTSDINVSVLAAVLRGKLTVKSHVLKMGKRNCYAEARALDENGMLVAVARVTKVILHLPRKDAGDADVRDTI
jgi:uncharacterized protein (TIGR00369 family)